MTMTDEERKENARKSRRAWREKNKDKIREDRQSPEGVRKNREYVRRWAAANPRKIAAKHQRRIERIANECAADTESDHEALASIRKDLAAVVSPLRALVRAKVRKCIYEAEARKDFEGEILLKLWAGEIRVANIGRHLTLMAMLHFDVQKITVSLDAPAGGYGQTHMDRIAA